MEVSLRRLFVIALCLLAGTASAFKVAGHGENNATVQSALAGAYYVRSVPSSEFGEDGETTVNRVHAGGDEVLDTYPIYMRGRLILGWSPIVGKWSLVHLEPVRITSNDDRDKVGKLESLRFNIGGTHLKTYTGAGLQSLGLESEVSTLEHGRPGDFLVRGIAQVSGTNAYHLVVAFNDAAGKRGEVRFDITSGERLH